MYTIKAVLAFLTFAIDLTANKKGSSTAGAVNRFP